MMAAIDRRALFGAASVEAALGSAFPYDVDGWSPTERAAWHDDMASSLNAAVAALDRDALIDRAATAIYLTEFGQHASDRPADWHDEARAVLAAIGLLPDEEATS